MINELLNSIYNEILNEITEEINAGCIAQTSTFGKKIKKKPVSTKPKTKSAKKQQRNQIVKKIIGSKTTKKPDSAKSKTKIVQKNKKE
jgi:hypothetical protein